MPAPGPSAVRRFFQTASRGGAWREARPCAGTPTRHVPRAPGPLVTGMGTGMHVPPRCLRAQAGGALPAEPRRQPAVPGPWDTFASPRLATGPKWLLRDTPAREGAQCWARGGTSARIAGAEELARARGGAGPRDALLGAAAPHWLRRTLGTWQPSQGRRPPCKRPPEASLAPGAWAPGGPARGPGRVPPTALPAHPGGLSEQCPQLTCWHQALCAWF